MKVTFLLTTIGCACKEHHPTAYLSAVLKEVGHQTSFLELDRIDKDLIDEEIRTFKPDVIAASTVMQQFNYVKTYLNYIKARYGHIKTVLGGTHAILKPQCIEEVKGLDAICVSEGEIPLLQFVNSLENNNMNYDIPSMHFRVNGGEIIKSPNTFAVTEDHLREFPHPDRQIFPKYKNHDRSELLRWYPRVLWGRGCPYACSYCAVPSLRKVFKEPLKASNTRWVRYPPVEKAIEEVELLRDRFIFDKYIIDDDVFTTRKDWIMEFADRYPSSLKDKVKYEANLRVESVDKEIMQALKDSGCVLLKFGLENGNYDVRRKILKRPISDEKIMQVFEWAHEVGIPAHTFNIIGIPTETKETIWDTIKLNRKIKPERVQITIFFPYYGTPLGDAARAKGLVTNETASYFSGQSSIRLENLTSKQVERYAKWFKFLVYYPYSPQKALTQLYKNTLEKHVNRLRQLISLLKNKGVIITINQVRQKIKEPKIKVIQVETLGADGERPHISDELQHLEDMANATKGLDQYDIEDMDANNPHMDAKLHN